MRAKASDKTTSDKTSEKAELELLTQFANAEDLSAFLKAAWSFFGNPAFGMSPTWLRWYQNLLRDVWRQNDPSGTKLAILYGFGNNPSWLEATAQANTGNTEIDWGKMRASPSGPDLSTAIKTSRLAQNNVTLGFLPAGSPVVDARTGTIHWKFGCGFQRAVYLLMSARWRAKVCPSCGKYFVAAKTAQAYCSPRCYREEKRKKTLEYWHDFGSAARKSKTASRRKRRNTTKAGR